MKSCIIQPYPAEAFYYDQLFLFRSYLDPTHMAVTWAVFLLFASIKVAFDLHIFIISGAPSTHRVGTLGLESRSRFWALFWTRPPFALTK